MSENTQPKKSRLHRNYRHAVKTKDLLTDDFIKSLGIKFDTWENRPNHVRRNPGDAALTMSRSAFCKLVKMFTEDAMRNNTEFRTPNYKYMNFYIGEMSKGKTNAVYKKMGSGVYGDVDLMQTDGKLYEFRVFSKFFTPYRQYPVRVSYKSYKEILVKKANEGLKYNGERPSFIKMKTSVDYIEEILALYPGFTRKQMMKIFKTGFERMRLAINNGLDVLVQNNHDRARIYIYHFKNYEKTKPQ